MKGEPMLKRTILLSAAVFSAVAGAASQSAILSNYSEVIQARDHAGQTYLSFMQKVVKPSIDNLVAEGYKVVDGKAVEKVYESVDTKVQGKIEAMGLAKVKRIADQLAGETVTLNTLPEKIAAVDRSVNRFDLATFIGLASGGGVAIEFAEENVAYNVHYDKTEQRSGRSFGASPTRGANDASDKAYLDDVTEYSAEGKRNLPEFYQTLLESLLDTNTKNYSEVSDLGQTVLTDFLAVYTAEQARNLMDGRVDIHWDAALLEVTLLASFHAGQDKFKFYYMNPKTQRTSFTDKVLNQTPCAAPERSRTASMRDYWQFSRRITDTRNCKRSGINITKKEFRKLEERITAYMYKNQPALAEGVQDAMGLSAKSRNLYFDLSKFLINDRTPKRLGSEAKKITAAWVDFLTQVTKEAADITAEIEARP
jgi:hypothetical protein